VPLNMQCTETPTCNISMLRVPASVAPEWATATRGRVQLVFYKHKRQLWLISKDSNDINLIKYYKQYCKILARLITEAKRPKYNDQIINSTNKMKTTWNIIKSETNKQKVTQLVIMKILLTPLEIIPYQ
jgi:hypothetical protein